MPQLKWDWKNDFLQQLNGNLADDSLNLMLESYDAINLSNNEVSKKYPNGRQILRMAIKDGVVQKNSVSNAVKKEYRQELVSYMKNHGYQPWAELFRQLISQTILRAASSIKKFP